MTAFDPAALDCLAALAGTGSFERAAEQLSVTQSAVSQRLRALEERVGTLLIRRGTPSVATEAGLRLIRHHDEVALLARDVAAAP